MRRLGEEGALIDRVLLNQFDGEERVVPEMLRCTILSKDEGAGQGKIRFNSRRSADYRDPATVECLVSQIDHIWI
ncbi:MAG: hypothetical protein MZV64_59695 [Ignavibacteriales bacterium]|nr:hypothetical protein [Ignavibacteriales bacterium]